MVNKEQISVGCVNGRFQPPHKGHREYILAAKLKCGFLWIGITHYDLFDKRDCEVAPHRSEVEANPLTYYERVQLIAKMLLNENISPIEFGFCPFPIDDPTHLMQFVPTTIPCFTTIYDEWNRHKVRVLRDLGYKVDVLWERKPTEKEFVGGKIRQSIRAGTSEWEQWVPESIIGDIREAHIEQR